MPLKLYADTTGRRTVQVAGDILLLLWIYFWASAGQAVRDATLALAEPGRQLESGATDVASGLRDAGGRADGLPLVGEELAAPFRDAGDAAEQIAAAGRQQAEAVTDLALLLGLVVAFIPITIAALVWVPPRVRFARRAAAAQRWVDSGADLQLFALRAMARQPMHVLARISVDPVAAWRTGESETVRALALLELRDCGLQPPPPRALPA